MELSINYVVNNKQVRMMSLADNIVFEADLNTGICKVIGSYDASSCSSYCYACQIDDYLLAAPSAITDFIIMDKNYRWTRIPIEERKGMFSIIPDLKTWTVFEKEHCAWKVGFTYPAIIKVNIETKEVEYINNWLEDVESRSSGEKDNAYLGNGYVINNDTLILPLFCCPGLLEMNMKTYEYEIHMFDSKFVGFRTLSGDEELWGETIQGSVVCISKEWQVKAQINSLEIRTCGKFAGGYWKPVLTENKVFLFPYYSTGIWEIDRNSYEVARSEINKAIIGKEQNIEMTSEVKKQSNKLYFFAIFNGDSGFFVYDLLLKTLEKHVFTIDEENKAIIMKERLKQKSIINESERFSLNDFLCGVAAN